MNRDRLADTLGFHSRRVRGRPLFDSLSGNRILRGKSKEAKVRAQVIFRGNRRKWRREVESVSEEGRSQKIRKVRGP